METYAPADLHDYRVAEVTYRCRDIGYGVEEGVFEGYWTGEVDTWGKMTWVDAMSPSSFPNELLYLFADELVDVLYLGVSA